MFLPSLIFCENHSFNRYMVECEYKLGAGVDAIELVLIDTWWNVNCTPADFLKAYVKF